MEKADVLNLWVSRVMTAGLYSALAVLGAGLAWMAVAKDSSLFGLAPDTVIKGGLFLLLITPTLSVGTCLVVFVGKKEWPGAALAAAVLAILVTGMALA